MHTSSFNHLSSYLQSNSSFCITRLLRRLVLLQTHLETEGPEVPWQHFTAGKATFAIKHLCRISWLRLPGSGFQPLLCLFPWHRACSCQETEDSPLNTTWTVIESFLSLSEEVRLRLSHHKVLPSALEQPLPLILNFPRSCLACRDSIWR